MKQKILQTIKEYNLIQNGDVILIGVSGGPDSICLLHVLNELKEELNFKIYVAHINHMIRQEADEETKYVQEFCKNLGVECFVKREDVIKQSKELKIGTEEMGRQVRYNFFEEVLGKTKANKIATAHNNNDKVETIIMNILRGSGTSGLKGIEAIRDNKYIRPLIETDREEIEKYCIKNNLKPKIDKSNNENIYTRNKIRNVVIPYIKQEFNPNILKTLNRLSEVATEENEYLNKITEETFNEIRVGAGLMPAQQNKYSDNPVGAHDCARQNRKYTKQIANDVGADDSVRPKEAEHKKYGQTESFVPTQYNQIILDLKKFNNLQLVIKRRIILYTINKVLNTTEGIEKVNIDDIIKLCSNNIGNKYLLPTKNIKILVKKGKIFFIPNRALP